MFTDGVRRAIASGSLLLFPVLLLLGFLTAPPDSDHQPEIFRAHPAKVEISAVLLHWAIIVMIFMVIGMGFAARTRALSQVGVVLGLVGTSNAAGLILADFYDLAAAQRLTEEQATALTAAVEGYAGYNFGFLIPSFLGHIGVLCLLIALVRDRTAPWWAPVLMVVGTFIPFLAVEQPPAVQSLGPLLQLVAYGSVALRLLRAPRVPAAA